ncbi:DUF1700 domain-containing protein [Microbacterium sp. No. 7]|uniref:DUF1700 domain-containing protein n=1 Tax=Microbacterium sp. No. 7 TaxID=1714373 RepID=UPI0006D219D0|nr:hypothetical protein [Microbacterium sp. No. 7]
MMSDTATPDVERYLHTLERALSDLPARTRGAIVDDVRAHISDALDAGRTSADVLTALGAPDEVARAARAELQPVVAPGGSHPTAPERALRLLMIAALVVAVATAVYVSFLLPAFVTVTDTSPSVGTVFGSYGAGAALLTLVPAVATALVLWAPRRLRRPFLVVLAIVMTVVSLISGFTIGGFFLPHTLLLWAAVIVPPVLERGLTARGSLAWRIAGAVVLASPALLAVSALASGAVVFTPGALIAPLVAIACAVLLFWKRRWASLAVAAVGASLMLVAAVDGRLLVLLFWLVGGVYPTVGLTAFVAHHLKRVGS